MRLTTKYFPKDYDFALAGLSFSYPEKDMRGALWRGDGPYRVWKGRLKGTRGPEYPEFKGYYFNF